MHVIGYQSYYKIQNFYEIQEVIKFLRDNGFTDACPENTVVFDAVPTHIAILENNQYMLRFMPKISDNNHVFNSFEELKCYVTLTADI